MTLLKSILFGIIQGLCEFLPISSSGHLALFQAIFGLSEDTDALAFNVLLHNLPPLLVCFSSAASLYGAV